MTDLDDGPAHDAGDDALERNRDDAMEECCGRHVTRVCGGFQCWMCYPWPSVRHLALRHARHCAKHQAYRRGKSADIGVSGETLRKMARRTRYFPDIDEQSS